MIGLLAEGYASGLAPHDTGKLRGSITHRQESKDTEVIGTVVEYAPYQEFGTSKMSPQPFLKPAVQGHISEYQQIVEACLHGG